MSFRNIGIVIGVGLVKFYQATFGIWLGGHCRFYPSCSQYAVEAIREHGLCRGSLMSVKRILRCHPLNPGGIDLVPVCRHGRHDVHSWRS